MTASEQGKSNRRAKFLPRIFWTCKMCVSTAFLQGTGVLLTFAALRIVHRICQFSALLCMQHCPANMQLSGMILTAIHDGVHRG
jgi:hypothetical protein